MPVSLQSWGTTMANHDSPGVLHRMLTALGSALKRGILGKSSHEYMKQFGGGDDYWDRVIAAEAGWPQKQPLEPDRFPNSEDTLIGNARPCALPNPHLPPVRH